MTVKKSETLASDAWVNNPHRGVNGHRRPEVLYEVWLFSEIQRLELYFFPTSLTIEFPIQSRNYGEVIAN